MANEIELYMAMLELKHEFIENKPNDRSPTDRYWAVTITDLEKVMAYFKTYVVDVAPVQATPLRD